MKAHFEMFAAYNAWANRRLYTAAAVLTDAERKADVGAFFRSMHGALNHMLCADYVWMRRFQGSGPAPTSVNEEMQADFTALREARIAMDDRITDFIADETDASLPRLITYTTIVGPMTATQRLDEALAHFFNHQTHHRGQCHHMLTTAGEDAPPLDLLYFQRDAG